MKSSKTFWSRVVRISTGWTGTWSAWRKILRTAKPWVGTSGFLGFSKLERSHVLENLLTRLRDGQLTLNPRLPPPCWEWWLGMVDAVRQTLKEIESTDQDGTADYPVGPPTGVYHLRHKRDTKLNQPEAPVPSFLKSQEEMRV